MTRRYCGHSRLRDPVFLMLGPQKEIYLSKNGRNALQAGTQFYGTKGNKPEKCGLSLISLVDHGWIRPRNITE